MMSEKAEAGLEKSAILMLALGEKYAARVMSELGPKEIQRLGMRMTKVSNISSDRIDEVITDLLDCSTSQSALGLNANAYIKDVLTRALGEEKAGFLLDTILTSSDTSGIEGLKYMDAQSVADLIRGEHPQIIATIMVHLDRDQCAAILNLFNEELASDVVLRIATLDSIQPGALAELNDVLSKLLTTGGDKLSKKTLGGARTAAEILNFVGGSNEKVILDSINQTDSELAESIQDEMFTFDNLVDISDKDMQVAIRRLDQDLLAKALKSATETIKRKVFDNMAKRASDALKEDIEMMGPVRISDIEAAQKDLLKTLRDMNDEGVITIAKSSDGMMV